MVVCMALHEPEPTIGAYSNPSQVDCRMRLHNLSAGPATLPEAVLSEVREELPVYRDAGASILEISHRSPLYAGIEQEAKQRLRRLLGVDESWHVLFLQGGASMQFYQIPLNFLPEDASADYFLTGRWAAHALREAQRVGRARVATSSEDRNFAYIPRASAWNVDPDAAYLHFTSNNTVVGTQFDAVPEVDPPLLCDASSDFLSRPIDMDRYRLMYAGAQKNVGPAGVTIVLVHDELLQRRRQPLPTMMDYGVHARKLFNTPPVFAVYLVAKVLAWIEGRGGLLAIGHANDRKARTLYERIDRTDFYRGTADLDARSIMNVTFRLAQEDLEPRFVAEAREEGFLGLKGHRSVGGMRASIYNACSEASVDALVAFMDDFERRYG